MEDTPTDIEEDIVVDIKGSRVVVLVDLLYKPRDEYQT